LSRWRLFSRLCSREKRKNLENASSAELATLVRDMVGSRAGIVHASLPKDDPVRRRRSSVVSDPWHGIYWYLSGGGCHGIGGNGQAVQERALAGGASAQGIPVYSDEVLVRREGEAVILEPVKRKAWPRGYWERLREMHHETDIQPLNITLQDVDVDSP